MHELICFDLDGVLADARFLHFLALDTALAGIAPKSRISWDEHLADYDGLPTRTKLALLTEQKGLDPKLHDMVWRTKQAISTLMIEQVFPQANVTDCVERLIEDGYTLACVSNSVSDTTRRMVDQIGLTGKFARVYGTDDVPPKPSPDGYLQVMNELGFLPRETWIVEDSAPGLQAAEASGAHVIQVRDPSEVTYAKIVPHLWQVEVPMAGAGARFQDAGYTFPKPLVEVHGKPMIQAVVENLGLPGDYTFIIRKEHEAQYHMTHLLERLVSGCRVVLTDGLTEGAACSALLADIDDRPLLIANSDQLLEWDPAAFADATFGLDGLIPTFPATHPKWSYAATEHGLVTRVAEKDPISDEATCGIYWWRDGRAFVAAAEKMIDAADRVNGEFYIAPVYNYHQGPVKTFPVGMHGLGTPEDLEAYLR